MFEDLRQDVRYALRSLAKHKSFTVTALLALGLAIGANTAIFSVVSGVILRPFPFAAEDRLVQLYGTPAERGESIVAAIREVSPNVAIFNVRTMDGVVMDSMSDFILYLSLMSAFAGIALFLASTGTYGVISYIASSRLREFAIRAALGAQRSQVTTLVLGDALRLTAIGLAVGIAGAIAATPLLQNLPVNVRRPDAAAIVPVAAVIAAIAILASLLPVRRAGGADPMSTLRSE